MSESKCSLEVFPSAANDPDGPVRCLQKQPKSDILQFDHILVKTGDFIRGRDTSLWQISLRPPELDGSIYCPYEEGGSQTEGDGIKT